MFLEFFFLFLEDFWGAPIEKVSPLKLLRLFFWGERDGPDFLIFPVLGLNC